MPITTPPAAVTTPRTPAEHDAFVFASALSIAPAKHPHLTADEATENAEIPAGYLRMKDEFSKTDGGGDLAGGMIRDQNISSA